MDERAVGLEWGVAAGYALGVGICFVATLGVWLQYSTQIFTAASGGAVALAGGVLFGLAAYLLRRPRP